MWKWHLLHSGESYHVTTEGYDGVPPVSYTPSIKVFVTVGPIRLSISTLGRSTVLLHSIGSFPDKEDVTHSSLGLILANTLRPIGFLL